MKDIKLNKKGFTLIELLSVIVILALLIVITANTILPLMNESKQNAMVVYAERILSNATAMYQADSITQGNTNAVSYSVKELMSTDDQYYGCVMVTPQSDNSLKFSIALFDDDNKFGVVKKDMVKATFDEAAKDVATKDNYEKRTLKTRDTMDTSSECKNSSSTVYTVK